MANTAEKQAELDDLKAQWASDPNWDIENTDGFEWAHDELLAYRQQKEAEWKAAEEKRLQDKSESMGCPGNVALVRFIEGLEHRIAWLEAAHEAHSRYAHGKV